LAAGLCPDPLGEFKRSPDTLAAVKGWGPREGRRKGRGREGGGGRREGIEGEEGEGRGREKGGKGRG